MKTMVIKETGHDFLMRVTWSQSLQRQTDLESNWLRFLHIEYSDRQGKKKHTE